MLEYILKKVDVMILTNSQIQTWLSCRRYYKFEYVDLLKSVEESPALRIGSAVHYALHYHYLGKDDGVTRFYDSIEHFTTPDIDSIETERCLVNNIMNGYRNYYADEKIEVLETEQVIKTNIASDTWFAGKIDMIAEIEGNKWLFEHKTTSNLENGYFDKLALDSQITGYLYLTTQKYPDIRGVVYNVLRKPSIRQKQNETIEEFYQRMKQDYLARPEFYFQRREVVRNDKELAEFPEYVKNIANEIRWNRGFFPRNPSQCNLYGSCTFRSLCIEYSPELANTYAKKTSLHEELDAEF